MVLNYFSTVLPFWICQNHHYAFQSRGFLQLFSYWGDLRKFIGAPFGLQSCRIVGRCLMLEPCTSRYRMDFRENILFIIYSKMSMLSRSRILLHTIFFLFEVIANISSVFLNLKCICVGLHSQKSNSHNLFLLIVQSLTFSQTLKYDENTNC